MEIIRSQVSDGVVSTWPRGGPERNAQMATNYCKRLSLYRCQISERQIDTSSFGFCSRQSARDTAAKTMAILATGGEIITCVGPGVRANVIFLPATFSTMNARVDEQILRPTGESVQRAKLFRHPWQTYADTDLMFSSLPYVSACESFRYTLPQYKSKVVAERRRRGLQHVSSPSQAFLSVSIGRPVHPRSAKVQIEACSGYRVDAGNTHSNRSQGSVAEVN